MHLNLCQVKNYQALYPDELFAFSAKTIFFPTSGARSSKHFLKTLFYCYQQKYPIRYCQVDPSALHCIALPLSLHEP